MRNKYTGIFKYPIYSNMVNAQGELPLSGLISCLIDAASRHAEFLGVGYRDLIKNNHAWVLARLAVEITRSLKSDEELTVETWVEGINKHFTTRNFRFLDQNNEVIGYACSIWSVIDFKSRESVDLNNYMLLSHVLEDKACIITRPGRINSIVGEPLKKIFVEVSDLDINRHMTSSQYVNHQLNLFDLQFFDENRIARFEIHYLNEARYGDQLQLFKVESNENEFTLEIKNQENISLSKSKCLFVNY